MKIKPKSVLLNLPIVLTFEYVNEIPKFASNINTLLNGKSKIKYEELGFLGEKFIGIFYLQRNDEFNSLREEFKIMIEKEEIEKANENMMKVLNFNLDGHNQ